MQAVLSNAQQARQTLQGGGGDTNTQQQAGLGASGSDRSYPNAVIANPSK